MEGATLMAVKSDWLNASTTLAAPNTGGLTSGSVTQLTTNCFVPYQHFYYPVYYQSPTRPIKLKLSEIEKLRKLAKADDQVKVILEKFTSLIEITVDFA